MKFMRISLILVLSIFLQFKISISQISDADIAILKERLLSEASSCTRVRSEVEEILNTTVGDGWTGHKPTEWERVAWLIRAYGCGQGNSQIRSRLISALDFAEENTPNMNNCSIANSIGFNWWELVHGIPNDLGPAMLFGGDNLPNDGLKSRMDDLFWHFYSCIGGQRGTGADAATAALNNLYGAVYFNDKDGFNYSDSNPGFQDGFDAAVGCAERSTINAGPYTQIRPDWSYFYHGDHINSQYSTRNAIDMPHFLYLVRGTDVYDRTRYKDGFFAWFANWNQWTTYLGEVDPLTAHKWSYYPYGYKVIAGAQYLFDINDPAYSLYSSVLQGIVDEEREPYGAISYPLDSYLVARRPDFFIGIKLISLDSPNMELSSFAHWMGSANILTPDNVGEKIGPSSNDSNVMDHPYQILGLTTLNAGMESKLYKPNNYYCKPTLPNYKDKWGWYGVTTLNGYYALAAQNYDWELSGGNLKLKKAWFVFDDEIITTQSGTTTDPGGIKTWMLTFKLNSSNVRTSYGSQTLPSSGGAELDLGNPSWIHTNNFGYVFLKNESILAKSISSGYVRIYADHSDSFASAMALLPGKSQYFTTSYANNNVEIIKLDENAHIIRDKSSGTIGAAMFSSVTSSYISTNEPAYIMYKYDSNNFNFSLYNPHHEEAMPLSDIRGGFNPKNDVRVNEMERTFTNYKITVPLILRNDNVDDVEYSLTENGNSTDLRIWLRVNRKLEIKGSRNGDGSYSITSATYGLNDASLTDYERPVEKDDIPPNPPTNLLGQDITENSIKLTWTASTKAIDDDYASKYIILRNGDNIAELSGTQYLDTPLVKNTTYNYEIIAVDDAKNESLQSATGSFTTIVDLIPPEPPTNLQNPNRTEQSIQLSWTHSVQASDGDHAIKYKIFRDNSEIDSTTNNYFLDSFLTENTIYSYKVLAIDDAGNPSSQGATGNFTTLSDMVPPTIKYVTLINQNRLVVIFSEQINAASAEDKDNYEINGIEITNAELDADFRNVFLTTSNHNQGSNYTLTINNVKDRATQPNTIIPNSSEIYYYPIYDKRINCGGANYTDKIGKEWEQENEYAAGGYGYFGGTALDRPGIDIKNTDDDPLYQSERWGECTYIFDVPNGSYEVRLLFAEVWEGAQSPGKRIFDVQIEDELVLNNFDIFAEVGYQIPVIKEYEINVADSYLNITFMIGNVNNPKISAIEVFAKHAIIEDLTSPLPPTGVSVKSKGN